MNEIEYKETLLAIDPGNEKSAYCLIDKKTYKPIKFGKVENNELLQMISNHSIFSHCYKIDVAIEMVASYGMAVGKTVFDTCVWVGRFTERVRFAAAELAYIYRKDVKMNFCNSMKAKDSNIRQALIDRFGEVGTKKKQGWFYGFKADIWSAYAVGITYLDIDSK